MAREMSLAVVGGPYPNTDGSSRMFYISWCATGEPVVLKRERKNPFDKHAVAVFTTRGEQIGYLTAERAPMIRVAMRRCGRRGRKLQAIFQEPTGRGAWIRANLDGDDPQLPASRGRWRSPAPDQAHDDHHG